MNDDDNKDDKGSIDYERIFLYLSLLGFCVLSWILFFMAAKNLIEVLF